MKWELITALLFVNDLNMSHCYLSVCTSAVSSFLTWTNFNCFCCVVLSEEQRRHVSVITANLKLSQTNTQWSGCVCHSCTDRQLCYYRMLMLMSAVVFDGGVITAAAMRPETITALCVCACVCSVIISCSGVWTTGMQTTDSSRDLMLMVLVWFRQKMFDLKHCLNIMSSLQTCHYFNKENCEEKVSVSSNFDDKNKNSNIWKQKLRWNVLGFFIDK